MKRSNSWARHSYPVQASPLESPRAGSLPSTEESPPEQIPKIIPAVKDAHNYKRQGRNLIICLDGTGDKFDSDNSNIVHFVGCLKKDDTSQVTYYQSGIGTYDGGGLSNGMAAAVDMAVGSGLGVHIRDAYRFLMQNYREGDKICLFGFSRGAYTARCLAGMLHKVGLLPAHNRAQIPFAYQFYKDDTPEGWKMSLGFKRTFCIDVSVYFIGVFDSVASVGFIPRKLPLSSTPTNKPTYFRHAMALDEHRAKFKPCRYMQKDHIDAKAHWNIIAEIHERPVAPVRRFSSNLGARRSTSRSNTTQATNEAKEEEDANDGNLELEKEAQKKLKMQETNVLEVWFTGCHADVGGGAVKNEVRHKLSQIPMRWMIRQCFECDTGILFHTHRLAEEGVDVHTLWPVYNRLPRPSVGPPPSTLERFEKGDIKPITHRSTALEEHDHDKNGSLNVKIWKDPENKTTVDHWLPEQVEDYFDALQPINDQLVQAKGWWVLEFWPIKVRIQPKHEDIWIKKVAMNLGRFRPVQDKAPNMHWTVEQRMKDKGYKLRTRVERDAEWHVVV